MALDLQPHRLSTAEYERMVDSGALVDLKVELLDGLLVDMSPESEVHWRVVHRLMTHFASRLDLLRVNTTLPVADGWVPEPDIALAHMDPGDLSKRPESLELVVEVAISSLARDRRKATVYGRAGIPRYWLVDVGGAVVLDHSEPGPAGYARVDELRGADVLDTRLDAIAATTVAELLAGTD